MPHISSKPLKEEDEKILKSRLIKIFQIIGKDKSSGYAIQEFLSPTEMIMLSKRLGIIYLIHEEKPTLDICEMLQVSSSTVLRIEKIFDRGGYKHLCKVMDKLEPSLLEIIETILGAGMPPIAGKGRWKFLDNY